MSIRFSFDINKTIAALAFLARRPGAKLDMFLSIKRLYSADRRALASWGKTITGDRMVSMDQGPVLSTVYNLFKGIGTADHLRRWKSYFGETVNNTVQLQRPPEFDLLSEDETDALEAAQDEIGSVAPWHVADFLHDLYPEWEDPHGGMRNIDPAKILRKVGRTEDEIHMIEESTESFNQIEKMFSRL
ncbi:MAG: Panacea domain-containing protein [Terracidiphilus sp.]|nr:Panacea domain-containing protein [Terracidiphilus sp.]